MKKKITLEWDGDNGKERFIVAKENDGWRDLRLTLDVDDCDSEYAVEMMQEVIDRCNRANDEN